MNALPPYKNLQGWFIKTSPLALIVGCMSYLQFSAVQFLCLQVTSHRLTKLPLPLTFLIE